MRKTFVLRAGSNAETLVLERCPGSWRLLRAGENVEAETVRLPDGRISILQSDGRQICGRVLPRGRGEVQIWTKRRVCRLGLVDPLHDRVDHAAAATGAEDSQEEILALMPGRVVEVSVKVGDRVEPGALLLVLEAMKMQNEIRTARGGIVDQLNVSAGHAVEGGTTLLTVRLDNI